MDVAAGGKGAVAGAGQDDGICESVRVLLRERSKEQIDRSALGTGFIERKGGNRVVGDDQAAVRRDHVNMIILELRGAIDLSDGHLGAGSEDAGELAPEFRIQVDNDDECCVGLVRQGFEKALKGFDPSR